MGKKCFFTRIEDKKNSSEISWPLLRWYLYVLRSLQHQLIYTLHRNRLSQQKTNFSLKGPSTIAEVSCRFDQNSGHSLEEISGHLFFHVLPNYEQMNSKTVGLNLEIVIRTSGPEVRQIVKIRTVRTFSFLYAGLLKIEKKYIYFFFEIFLSNFFF